MKKAMFAVVLLCSVFAGSASAYDFVWTTPVPSSRALVTKKMNIDGYLPWSSGGSARAMGMGGAYTAVANDLGGSVEYNPAGLTQLGHVTISALAIARRNTDLDASGKKTSKWKIVPTQAGAALRIGPVAVAVSRKQPETTSAFQKYSSVQSNLYAPDGWRMSYTKFSDKLDTKNLDTMVLTGAIRVGKLSLGANYNSIKGDIVRTQRGRNDLRAGLTSNNYFNATEKVNFKGYTMDAGLIFDMGAFQVGAAAKNFKGSVDVKRDITWQDNFDVGAGNTWNWVSPSSREEITKFAPTTTVGAALILGKILTLDVDYSTTKLEDSKRNQARVGAELAVIPGFLFARAGVKADLKNKIEDQDNKTNEYFVGAGLKMLMLTVDASASLASAKAGSAGDNMSGGVSATLKF